MSAPSRSRTIIHPHPLPTGGHSQPRHYPRFPSHISDKRQIHSQQTCLHNAQLGLSLREDGSASRSLSGSQLGTSCATIALRDQGAPNHGPRLRIRPPQRSKGCHYKNIDFEMAHSNSKSYRSESTFCTVLETAKSNIFGIVSLVSKVHPVKSRYSLMQSKLKDRTRTVIS